MTGLDHRLKNSLKMHRIDTDVHQKIADLGRYRISVPVFADRTDHPARRRAYRLPARLNGKTLAKHPRGKRLIGNGGERKYFAVDGRKN